MDRGDLIGAEEWFQTLYGANCGDIIQSIVAKLGHGGWYGHVYRGKGTLIDMRYLFMRKKRGIVKQHFFKSQYHHVCSRPPHHYYSHRDQPPWQGRIAVRFQKDRQNHQDGYYSAPVVWAGAVDCSGGYQSFHSHCNRYGRLGYQARPMDSQYTFAGGYSPPWPFS